MAEARTLRNDKEKMAEETRFRSPRGYGQPQAQAAVETPRARRGEDPLAELARLIGQEDPFAEFGGVQQRRRIGAGADPRQTRQQAPQPDRYANGRNANGAHARDVAPEAPKARSGSAGYSSQQPRSVRGYDERDHRESNYERQPARAPQARAPARNGNGAAYEDYGQARSREQLKGRATAPAPAAKPRAGRDEYDDYAQPRTSSRGQYAEDPRYTRRAERAPEEARYGRSRQAPAYDDQYDRAYENDYDPDYVDDGYLPEHADDIYGEVPRPRRRWGLVVVIGILIASAVAVAFLGVFAYRTIFNTPARPPVVTKSSQPTKVDPKNAPQAIAAANKPVQDRIGPSGPEQILPREEQPTDLTQTGPRATPFTPERVAQQPSRAPAFTSPPAQEAAPPAQTQTTPSGDARRVRTVTVRADGTVVPNNAPANNTGPLPLNANQNSLEPETPTPPAPRANTNPNRPLAAVAPPAPAPQTASGNYVVQVASHKTQEEAQAAWNTLRTQHTGIFNGRNADIRRVDLGDRGTFYRAMVGPMSRDQANALCQNLKTAGGGCIVQTRN